MGADAPRSGVKPGGWKGKSKKATAAEEKIQQAAIIGLISVGLNAAYASVGVLTKDDHWSLNQAESAALAAQINSCLETLPGKIYAEVIAKIEQFLPWIGLAITASAITIPRIEQSRAKREAAKTAKRGAQAPGRDEREQPFANPFEYGRADGGEHHSYTH